MVYETGWRDKYRGGNVVWVTIFRLFALKRAPEEVQFVKYTGSEQHSFYCLLMIQ